MKPEQEIPQPVTTVAEQWARRCTAGLSAAERREFEVWIAADPRHRAAFARANTSGADCDWSWQAGATDEIVAGLAVRRRRRVRRRLVATGSAVAALCLAGILWQVNRASTPPPAAAAPGLVVVQPRRQTLPDGSIVELKDGAQITSDFSGTARLVSLTSGTAHFQVAKNPQRPFVVQAGGLAVRAVGTAFTVELASRDVTVLVTEGNVRVDPSATASVPTAAMASAPLATVAAGNSVVLMVGAAAPDTPAVKPVAPAELAEIDGWRIPKLEFSSTPLRDVIGQMNRHNERQFVLGDEAVGELRVSGILRADKMETLTRMLETDFQVRAERRSAEIVLTRAR